MNEHDTSNSITEQRRKSLIDRQRSVFSDSEKPDMFLIEREADCGLTRKELTFIMDSIMTDDTDKVVPIELDGNASVAMGLIREASFERIGYDYTELQRIVADILDDMNNETEDKKYTRGINGVCFNFVLTRDIDE